MKVLIIINHLSYGGGAESMVYDIYINLKKNLGRENVMLIALDDANKNDNRDLYEKELDNDEMYKVCNSKLTLSVLGKNNVNIDSLKNTIHQFKPNIIHSHLYLSELISELIFNSTFNNSLFKALIQFGSNS